MLIDDGVIDTSARRGRLARRPGSTRTAAPSRRRLTGVLQARLDALVADERRALQCAAVVGRVFWDAAVALLCVTGRPPRAALDAARRRELVFRREHASFEDTRRVSLQARAAL